MQGKVCVVTGASSGVGKAMAIELARRGARVVVCSRSEALGQETLAEVKAIAQARGDREEPILEVANLSSLVEVRGLAERLRRRFEVIHVLMNNAGLYLPNRRLTVDGYDVVFTVNHLAPFLLTNLLRDRLAAAGNARVVATSSVGFRSADLDMGDLMMAKGRWRGLTQYANSKLAIILFTREATRRFADDGIRLNCFHPGGTRSRMAQDEPNWIGWMWKNFGFLLRRPEKGAETGVYLATSPEVENVSGEYFTDLKVQDVTPAARDEVLSARMWDVSMELTGLDKPGERSNGRMEFVEEGA
ncbi:SDR family oxidoreductase [Pendulispora rubella]|uniref:SDR family oxidoreductase n=1 Tax=Pendulispora rubella TaxID=2741070 RepID=A0ABZ2LH16_9BACT